MVEPVERLGKVLLEGVAQAIGEAGLVVDHTPALLDQVQQRAHLPRRHGLLFDPDRFPFLEGRVQGDLPTGHRRASLPLVPDGTIYRALEKLLGKRLAVAS